MTGASVDDLQRLLTGKRPGFKYYTKHVMDRKLKSLTDRLTGENILPIAKVVFSKFREFVKTVSTKAQARMAKKKLRTTDLIEGGNGNRIDEKFNEVGPWKSGSSDPLKQPIVTKEQQTKKPLHERKNKNRQQKKHRRNKKGQKNGAARITEGGRRLRAHRLNSNKGN